MAQKKIKISEEQAKKLTDKLPKKVQESMFDLYKYNAVQPSEGTLTEMRPIFRMTENQLKMVTERTRLVETVGESDPYIRTLESNDIDDYINVVKDMDILFSKVNIRYFIKLEHKAYGIRSIDLDPISIEIYGSLQGETMQDRDFEIIVERGTITSNTLGVELPQTVEINTEKSDYTYGGIYITGIQLEVEGGKFLITLTY